MAVVEVVDIHNNPSGIDYPSKLNDEYVVFRNTTSRSQNMTNWIVSDRTPTGKETHIFRFPPMTLDPGIYIFLMTGSGIDGFIPASVNHPPQFHIHMQRRAFIWNNQGDTAFLRLPNGQIVDSLRVP